MLFRLCVAAAFWLGHGMTFWLLMRYGYDVQDFRIIGGPRDRHRSTGHRQESMIRGLLANRFHLKVHFERKNQLPAYALVSRKQRWLRSSRGNWARHFRSPWASARR